MITPTNGRQTRILFLAIGMVVALPAAFAQQFELQPEIWPPAMHSDTAPDQSPQPPVAQTTPAAQTPPGGNRVGGILPNYRTASAADEATPISARRKFLIARQDSFDFPTVILAGVFAGWGQLNNDNPSFGQGTKGFAHRLVTSYGDRVLGNMLSEGVFPVLLHEDPRYFRRGTGSTKSRLGYALSRTIITKTDSGKKRFNYSEWLGNASAVAISNAYYPDTRTAGDAVSKLLTQCGTDMFGQILREFWPDIRKKFLHKD